MAGVPALSQLNVRFESDIKQAGDAVLKEAGISATQFIRGIWRALGEGGEGRDALLRVVDGSSAHQIDEEKQLRLEAIKRGPMLYYDALSELGISGDRFKIWDMSLDDEMLYQELTERMESRLS